MFVALPEKPFVIWAKIPVRTNSCVDAQGVQYNCVKNWRSFLPLVSRFSILRNIEF